MPGVQSGRLGALAAAAKPMRSKPPLLLVFLFLGLCFVLGIASTLLDDSGDEASATPALRRTATPTRRATPTPGPAAVYFFGVDELESEHPRLLAVWMATFERGGSDVFLFGFPTDTQAGGDSSGTLGDLFAWDPAAGPSPHFEQALQTVTLLPARMTVVLDRVGFQAVVNHLGGVELSGVRLSGAETVAVLELWQDDPTASVEAQARVLEALAQRAPRAGATPDLTLLLSLIPDHAYLSLRPAEAALLLAPLLPLGPDSIHVTTLTLPGGAPHSARD